MGRTKFDRFSQWLQSVIIFVLGTACFIFILINRQPIPLRPLALQARSGFTLFAPIALMLFFLVFSIKGFPGRLLSFVFILSLFALGLSGLWASGQTEPQVIGGLLPNVDAAEYYNNALRLMNGSNFFDYSSRRPIFPSYLTTLLWMSHKNLQVTLGIMVFIVSICTFIGLSLIRKRFNSLVSAIFFILAYLFFRRYSGLVMSENLGFPLGIMSFALLMEGVFENKKKLAFLSLFLLSYALNVRAGAFFILPLIALSLWKLFGKDAKLKTALILISIVATGFIINLIIFKLLGSATGTPFSNFAHTFYGLAQGGKGWTQIYADHPEILNLRESEISQKIYEYSWAAIKSNPWIFVSGFFKQYGIFINFINSNLSIFSFVYGENEIVYYLTQIILYLLFLIGLFYTFINRIKPFHQILLLAFLGTLLSVPFITADASYMRAYAASLSFIVVFPAIGAGEIIKIFTKMEPVNPYVPHQSYRNFTVIMTVILIAIPLMAILPRHFNLAETNGRQSCPAGEENIAVDISRGSFLSIFPNSELFLDWVPNLHETRFKSSFISSRVENMREEVRRLPARMQISNTIDLYSYKDLMLIIKDENMFGQIGRFSICGKWSDYPQFINVTQFFYAETYKKID